MIRRDTERYHMYADEVFSALNIYDIQGVLKEGDSYKCGIESYQVKSFDDININLLNSQTEYARWLFCEQLDVPYYLIFVAEDSKRYYFYRVRGDQDQIIYKLSYQFNSVEFINWWRSQQSFSQKKAMYNAAKRIEHSIIDNDLFANELAWGINVDGFTLCNLSKSVNCIYEKRICTYKPPYTVDNYDPNRFFHGTFRRSGDYASWKILNDLSNKLNSSLVLLTFDTSKRNRVGVAKINDVTQSGLHYLNNIPPSKQLFVDDLRRVKERVKSFS